MTVEKINGAPTLTKLKVYGIICYCKRKPHLHNYDWKCHIIELYNKYYGPGQDILNIRMTNKQKDKVFSQGAGEMLKLIKELLQRKERALKGGDGQEARKIRRRLRRLDYKRYLRKA